MASTSNELGIVRSVVQKQQAEIRSLRDELFDQNMQMIDQLTKLAGVNANEFKVAVEETSGGKRRGRGVDK